MGMQTDSEPITVTPLTTPTTTTEYLVMGEEELERPYRVIVQNDEVTPMDFVVIVLRLFFDLEYDHAVQVMLEAHTHGQAYVATLPLREAQDRIYAAHHAAREAGYPLTFHLEPEG